MFSKPYLLLALPVIASPANPLQSLRCLLLVTCGKPFADYKPTGQTVEMP